MLVVKPSATGNFFSAHPDPIFLVAFHAASRFPIDHRLMTWMLTRTSPSPLSPNFGTAMELPCSSLPSTFRSFIQPSFRLSFPVFVRSLPFSLFSIEKFRSFFFAQRVDVCPAPVPTPPASPATLPKFQVAPLSSFLFQRRFFFPFFSKA